MSKIIKKYLKAFSMEKMGYQIVKRNNFGRNFNNFTNVVHIILNIKINKNNIY